MDEPDFFTLDEIATLLRVRVSAVRARLGRNDPGLPPSLRIGGRRLFPRALYLEWRQRLLRTETALPVGGTPTVKCVASNPKT